ncbi:MAG: hypothetical protein KDD47_14580 [Acidobacteria bacterium]|nr:hypothetical protein [Acidobacteriota bacterium]
MFSSESIPKTVSARRVSLPKALSVAVLSAAMLVTPGLVPQAEAASLSLHFGGGFRIGGVFFNIGVHARDGHYHDHYYRTSHRLRYDGYSCSRACYRDEKYTYHHRSCPVVSHHLRRYGYDAGAVFNTYAPRYEGRSHYDRYDRSYRDDGRYDRDDRYDRRYRRDDRYDRYDRRSRSCDRPRSRRY